MQYFDSKFWQPISDIVKRFIEEDEGDDKELIFAANQILDQCQLQYGNVTFRIMDANMYFLDRIVRLYENRISELNISPEEYEMLLKEISSKLQNTKF